MKETRDFAECKEGAIRLLVDSHPSPDEASLCLLNQ